MNVNSALYKDELARMTQAIRKAREAAGLSLSDVAAQLGVSPSTVGKIEQGSWNPSAGYLIALARAYGLSWRLE